MHFDKGLIILNTFDLDLAAKCPYSIALADQIRARKECLRCLGFSEIAKYCFSRAFRGTNLPSIKTLTNRYENILLNAGIDQETCDITVRKDIGILADLLDLSQKYQSRIDLVNPEINLNFGRFSIRDHLDAILCMNGEYFIVKFKCDDHASDWDILRYETIAGSLWIRASYDGVNDNSVCFIQLSRTDPPILRQAQMMPPTEKLYESIEEILTYLEPEGVIKTEKDFILYKQEQLKNLPIRFGNHCWDCQDCFGF